MGNRILEPHFIEVALKCELYLQMLNENIVSGITVLYLSQDDPKLVIFCGFKRTEHACRAMLLFSMAFSLLI